MSESLKALLWAMAITTPAVAAFHLVSPDVPSIINVPLWLGGVGILYVIEMRRRTAEAINQRLAKMS